MECGTLDGILGEKEDTAEKGRNVCYLINNGLLMLVY